jgi:hypothetical protein
MKKWLLLSLVILNSLVSFNQKSTEKILKKQHKDFTIFKTSLMELEANLYDHITEDSLANCLNKLESKVTREVIDDKSLFKEYSGILVRIQSGHTNLRPTSETYKYWVYEKNSLPMDVVMVGQKLYTNADYSVLDEEEMKKLSGREKKENFIPKYTEIYSIDGKTIPIIMEEISPYLSSDYNDIYFKYYLVKDLFEFYRNLTLKEDKSQIEVKFLQKRDTLTKLIELGYPPVEDINKRLKEEKKNKTKRKDRFGTFSIESSKYGYFRFPSFEKSKGRQYKKFLAESFEKIEKKEIENIVVDLRDNTGGYVQYEFLTYLFPEKKLDTLGQFVITKRNKPSYKKYVAKNDHYRKLKRLKRKRKRQNKKSGSDDYGSTVLYENLGRQKSFGGKIIVITNEATFSAASMLAADLKHLYGAKIIGSPAGGSFYKGATGNISVELPHSGFVITYNPVYYRSSYSHYIKNISEPDVLFIPEFKDPKKDEKNNQKNIMKLIKQEFRKRN